MSNRWIVHAEIESALDEHACFEICVVRENNIFGQRSYGWFGKDKLLISHNGGPCHWPITKKVLTKLLKVAEEVADELNQEESAHGIDSESGNS